MMSVADFGLVVLIAGAVVIAAVLSSRLSERLRIPAPAFFLLGAAVAAAIWPRVTALSFDTVQNTVTIALIVILFDGGMHIGWRRFRSVAVPTASVGVVGTFATAAAVGVAAHLLFSFAWRQALLLGTALAPTDPAVVFSVLGQREVSGRSGVLLQGESGANDPVGIALLVAMLGASGSYAGLAATVFWKFALQMGVGVAAGLAGGWLLLVFMRKVSLPSEGLYSLRVLAAALAIYGVATAAHGSGFLAVFIAGLFIGDERAPYKREIARFHSSLASLAEVVAFVMLGLSFHITALSRDWAWLIGLLLAIVISIVIRPLLVGLLLWPVRLRAVERVFTLWAGLKGAVPVLLGATIVHSGVPDAPRLYAVIFVVVAFSVTAQGGTVPLMARRLGIPMRVREVEPWALGVRLREEPEGVHRFVIRQGSPADDTAIGDLDLPEDAWVSLAIRGGRLLPVHASTELKAGDEIVVLAGDDQEQELRTVFSRRAG